MQASQKKFLEYIQTGALEKMVKVLEKGLDPNFHDVDTGGEFLLFYLLIKILKSCGALLFRGDTKWKIC